MLTYRGLSYTTTAESIYADMSIEVSTLAEATRLCEEFADMTEYVFDGESYSNMVVSKRVIIITSESTTVKVKLRNKTELEMAQEELAALRAAMQELAQTTNETTTEQINAILNDTRS